MGTSVAPSRAGESGRTAVSVAEFGDSAGAAPGRVAAWVNRLPFDEHRLPRQVGVIPYPTRLSAIVPRPGGVQRAGRYETGTEYVSWPGGDAGSGGESASPGRGAGVVPGVPGSGPDGAGEPCSTVDPSPGAAPDTGGARVGGDAVSGMAFDPARRPWRGSDAEARRPTRLGSDPGCARRARSARGRVRALRSPADGEIPDPVPLFASGPEPIPAIGIDPVRRPVLRARDLRVEFAGVPAVDGVSMWVERGEVVGVVGPAGSGKTTLLNALTGVVPATGALFVEGLPVRLGSPERSRRAGLVRMFQTPQPVRALSGADNFVLTRSDTRHRGLLAAWLLHPLLARVDLERGIGTDRAGPGGRPHRGADVLTYGERRLLDIARGIAAVPRVLMLDEPSAGLNARETDALLVLLRGVAADGVGLIVVDRRIDFVEALCDRVTVMDTGRVVAEGTPAEIRRNRRAMDACLGAGAGYDA